MRFDNDLPPQTLTYSIIGGADASHFSIDSASGLLSFVAAPDAETPLDSGGNNTYLVIVRASDGTSFDSQVITVNVNDVNEFPITPISDLDANPDAVDENATVGQSVGILANATDADGINNVISYSLLDDDGGRFAIDATSGAVTVGGAIDFETGGPTRSISVRAQSADGSFSDRTFSIAVNDVSETPVAVADDFTVVAGDTLVQAAPGVLANDSDGDGDPLTAILLSPTSNGVLSLDPNGAFIYQPNSGFVGTDVFRYQVSDGSLLSSVAEVRIDVTIGAALPSGSGGSAGDSGGDSGSGTGGGDGDTGGGDPIDEPLDPIDESPTDTGEGTDSGTTAAETTPETSTDAGDGGGSTEASSVVGNAGAIGGVHRRSETSDSEGAEANEISELAGLGGGGGSSAVDRVLAVAYQSAMGNSLTQSLSLDSAIPELRELERIMQLDIEQAIVWDLWDNPETEYEESQAEIFVGSAGTAAGFFSIGYVLWALRGGAFVSVMASSMPAWRIVDPAALLTAYRGSQQANDGLDEMIG